MKFRTLLFALMAISVFTASAQLSTNNASRHYENFKKYFKDAICSEMHAEYAELPDTSLSALMKSEDLPTELINVALKVKNNAWGKYEKEFRVAKFKPYSEYKEWDEYMDVYTYTLMPNPTGITGNNESIMIFVGEELPDSIELGVSKVEGNDGHGFLYNKLKKGLNVISMPEADEAKMLFIDYYVKTDTSATSKRLADYPDISIHIEGGHMNGYFDITKHDDDFWRELIAMHKEDSVASSYTAIQVKGRNVIFHMNRKEIVKVCPNTITDAINWWDQLVTWQHELMGAVKYRDRWNDMIMARDGKGSYMFATQGYTYYESYTLGDILPWENVYESPGRMWGPAHEIGHVNQGAISMAGCTEVSNNLFANAQIHRAGKSTTRGREVAQCVKDFTNKVPYALRDDVFSRTRMYFQLYLYFHAAGKDTTFYPRLFEELRHDPLYQGDIIGYNSDGYKIYNTRGKEDQLKFAEKCCEVAQMDLSEFFEAWGFFVPMDSILVGDYGDYYITMTAEEVEASRQKMLQYEKKGKHLIFLEDRAKPSPRTDGVEGNRIDFTEEVAVGKMGDTGQWGDYIDESVKAEGYYFSKKTNKIEIVKTEGAKGALGFKLYDANTGELLSFSNTYSITIPAYAFNSELKVVVSQADGSDIELMDVSEANDENLKKIALEALLSEIKNIIKNKTKNGDEIGYFYADALTEIEKLYNTASEAVKNNDTNVHTYVEWYELVSEEFKKLMNTPEARATMKAGEVYSIRNSAQYKYYMAINNDKELIGESGKSSEANKKWVIEEVNADGTVVIKNKDAEYINDVELNHVTMCNGDTIDAGVAFYVIYNDDATICLKTADEEGLYLTLKEVQVDSKKKYHIVGSSIPTSESQWAVTRIEKPVTSIEEIVVEKNNSFIYDLQGRKVENPQKGIYIKNGKVIVIR